MRWWRLSEAGAVLLDWMGLGDPALVTLNRLRRLGCIAAYDLGDIMSSGVACKCSRPDEQQRCGDLGFSSFELMTRLRALF